MPWKGCSKYVNKHWNRNVAILTKFSSLVTPKVIKCFVQPVMKILQKWRHFRFKEITILDSVESVALSTSESGLFHTWRTDARSGVTGKLATKMSRPTNLLFADTRRHAETFKSWWRHQMETFSALPVHSAGNSPVTGEFPAQMPVTHSFDVFFDLRLNKRLSKQSWGWWFETPSRPLWRHCNVEI